MADFVSLAKPKMEVMTKEKFLNGKHRFIYAICQHMQVFLKIPLFVYKERTMNLEWHRAMPASRHFLPYQDGSGYAGITPMFGFNPSGAAGQMVDLLRNLKIGDVHILFYSDNVYVLENPEGIAKLLSLDGQSYEISF